MRSTKQMRVRALQGGPPRPDLLERSGIFWKPIFLNSIQHTLWAAQPALSRKSCFPCLPLPSRLQRLTPSPSLLGSYKSRRGPPW